MQQFFDKKCLTNDEWYLCPLSITTFTVFLFLFIYSVSVCITNASAINTEINQPIVDKSKLRQLQALYIANLIGTFVSFAVLVVFVSRAIGTEHFIAIFNKYLAIVFIMFLFIITCWNISVYANLENTDTTGIQTVNGLVLSILCIVLIGIVALYIYQQNKTTR